MTSRGNDGFGTLLKRLRDGEREALGRVVERCLPHLRTYVRARLDPELRRREGTTDIVQSVVREVLVALPRLEYQGEPAFLAWLARVTWNKINGKKRWRLAGRRDARRDASGNAGAPPSGSAVALAPAYAAFGTASQRLMLAEDIEFIERFLHARDPWDREIVHLARVLNLPWDGILAELSAQGYPHKMTRAAVEARFKRTMADLRRVIRKGESPAPPS